MDNFNWGVRRPSLSHLEGDLSSTGGHAHYPQLPYHPSQGSNPYPGEGSSSKNHSRVSSMESSIHSSRQSSNVATSEDPQSDSRTEEASQDERQAKDSTGEGGKKKGEKEKKSKKDHRRKQDSSDDESVRVTKPAIFVAFLSHNCLGEECWKNLGNLGE